MTEMAGKCRNSLRVGVGSQGFVGHRWESGHRWSGTLTNTVSHDISIWTTGTDFTVLSTHIRVFNLLIQTILSAIDHAGGGVTEWLRDTLHGGGVFVIDHPRGAGLDVAPLHTALFLAARVLCDLIVGQVVLARLFRAGRDTGVVGGAFLALDGTEGRSSPLYGDALSGTLMSKGGNSGTETLTVSSRVTGARIKHTSGLVGEVVRHHAVTGLKQ